MHISKSRRLLKPCFIERCPHCRRTDEFWLVELSGQVGFIGGTGYSIACKQCDFEKPISKADAKIFDAIAQEYRDVKAGLLAVDAFQARIDARKLPVMEQLRAEARSWNCEKCSEENPSSFDLCWKCGAVSPVPSSDAPQAPELPDVGGRHPWEQ
jgi:hypothetical protein